MVKRDSQLITEREIADRIASINRQVDKLENVWNPRDFNKHHNKILKLHDRKRALRKRLSPQ